jgi:hypothetical protein
MLGRRAQHALQNFVALFFVIFDDEEITNDPFSTPVIGKKRSVA